MRKIVKVSSGKTVFLLTKDFEELVEMAERGDSRKVDTLAGDLKNREREGTDWYLLMEDDLHVFALGKLSESKYNGRENFPQFIKTADVLYHQFVFSRLINIWGS